MGWPNVPLWRILKGQQKRYKRLRKLGEQQRVAMLADITVGINDNPQEIFDAVLLVVSIAQLIPQRCPAKTSTTNTG